MIELILDKKSIQIDEEFLDIKKHLEKFDSNKEPLNLSQIKQICVLKVLTYEMIQTLKNQIIHLAQVVNEENLEKDEELVVYHLDFTLTQQSYKILAKFCVIKKERNIA
ncbi:hypothetical protein [Helicobacter pylori]|uniref:hypothetical protein n=1 Tax=Helicobacter pylori TaxID=210 RepID=UPI001FF5E558|nr:hypothetical protein [Helicobacter pylori]MCK0497519.1 hypothetical protein [Helicobacter pylori]